MNFRRRTKLEHPGFQLAPMIDIVFNLLFFSITTQIYSQWETEINVKLPTAESSNIPQRLPGEIIINVLEDGTMIVNKQVMNEESLANLLTRIVKLFPGQPVLIRGDRKTSYEHIVHVLDQCRRSDIWNISFATITGDEKDKSTP